MLQVILKQLFSLCSLQLQRAKIDLVYVVRFEVACLTQPIKTAKRFGIGYIRAFKLDLPCICRSRLLDPQRNGRRPVRHCKCVCPEWKSAGFVCSSSYWY
jgi:hypothetical protein